MDIKPFEIQIPQTAIDDLRNRLANTRWTDEIVNSDWEFGASLSYIKDLADYWQTQFDWRAQENAINSFAQFRADIDGFGIHFIHERGKGANSFPLVITHGFPGSFAEMLKIIPMLTDPARYGGDAADSFDVIVPS